MEKIVIIGAGIAGLSAGIFAQKAGFDSIIFEQHHISGGECTGWDRKGFHIDGCIHWLTGTNPQTDLYNLWQQTGALEDVKIHQPEIFATVEHEGQTVTLYRDIDKLTAHLLDISPQDQAEIEKLMGYVQRFFSFQMPCKKPFDLMSLTDKIKLGLSMKEVGPVMKELGKITLAQYLQRFKSPAIKEALKSGLIENNSAYILPFTLATFITGNGGRPAGGSRALAKRMEEKYLSLGGQVELGQAVKEISVQNNHAHKIVLVNGSEVHGDYIVPTCDANVTLNKLLSGNYQDNSFAEKYANEDLYPLFSSIYVALGVDADLTNYPADFVFQSTPYPFENHKRDQISLKHYSYEPSFAPENKSILIAYLHADYGWWKEKRKVKEEYKAEKTKLGNNLIERIEARFPELKHKITLLDVATPLTYERYCGAYKGAWMAFGVTPKGNSTVHNGKIKGINNLYMGGQWLMPPGGLPTAVVTGKWAIQRICRVERVKFDT